MSPFVKRHATTIVLAALAAGVAGYVLVIDKGSVTTAEAERRQQNLLPAWRVDDITRVSVELEGSKYALVRKASGDEGEARSWDVVMDDKTYPADEQAVDQLLGTIGFARHRRRVPDNNVDRAAFGLDNPRSRLSITMGTLSFELVVGGAAGTPDTSYAEVVGHGVFVVSQDLVKALEIPSDTVRSKTLLPYLSTELAALSLTGEGGVRTFERASWSGGRGSGYRFAPGSEGRPGERVDGARLDYLLVAMGRMQAELFLSDELAASSSTPRVTLTLTPREGPKAVVVVGGACPDREGFVVVVRKEPTPLAACVTEQVMPPLVRGASYFEDYGLIGAAVDEISEVRIDRDGKVFDMVRSGSAFKVRQPQERELALDAGSAFLQSLVGLRGEPAPSDAVIPQGDGIHLRVMSIGGVAPGGGMAERTEEIEIGPLVEGRRLVVRKEDGARLFIGGATAHTIGTPDLILREQAVLSIEPEDIDALSIEGPGPRRQRFERQADEFALVEPKGKGLSADPYFAKDAWNAIARLNAERWVADADDGSFGLEPPRMTIVAFLSKASESEDKEVRVRLGKKTDDGTYATIDTRPEVFLAPNRFTEVMERWHIRRGGFVPDRSDIDRLIVEVGADSVAFRRDGRELKLEGDAAEKDRNALEARLQEALKVLTPIEAVTVGPPTAEQGLTTTPGLRMVIMTRQSPDTAPEDQLASKLTYTFGDGDSLDGIPVRFARRDDIDATFAIGMSATRLLAKLVDEKPAPAPSPNKAP